LVAGGIGPDNVTDALAQSGAWGVDVSSGVELSPGIKDAVLMKRLFARIGAVRDLAACAVSEDSAAARPEKGI
jgi:phosphoribosylanthranilate isomerase